MGVAIGERCSDVDALAAYTAARKNGQTAAETLEALGRQAAYVVKSLGPARALGDPVAREAMLKEYRRLGQTMDPPVELSSLPENATAVKAKMLLGVSKELGGPGQQKIQGARGVRGEGALHQAWLCSRTATWQTCGTRWLR